VPSHVFGPVPSRRLGRSLGVDLVPFKTCSYDCIYCQLGRTTCKTVERREWVPLDDVVAQVDDKLSTAPDYITLSGSGEPTLYSRLGALIAAIKRITKIPVAVLTNGSLLWDEDVQEELAGANLVVPSLDAGDEMLFRHVNRPHEAVSFERMVEGLREFRARFRGACWLEVFLLGGITGIRAEVEKIGRHIARIRPDRVQLNTATRPPAEDFAFPVSQRDMQRYAAMLGERAEVIADFRGVHRESEFAGKREDVLGLLRRRPCTVEDIASGLGIHRNEAVKYVSELLEHGAIVAGERDYRTYYKAS
jgi:wyosine [tRNA(Phe)-imidazoG37] synthetase (radical SAM superfamily)